MIEEELKYWVGLAGMSGLGRKRFELLKQYFGSLKRIWQADKRALEKTGLNRKLIEEWDNWKKNYDLEKEMEEVNKRLIKVITIEDERYPKLLKEVDIAPFILFVKGRVDILSENCLAVVGTRKITDYGKSAVKKLVRDLVKENLVIVSGLARGVDSWAHRVCLGNKGKTVAVLGHGLDRIYPRENIRLAEEIVKSGGALVSEYPVNYSISKGNFPARNRIVAGMSLGVLIIEGAHRSGTKITANWAVDFNREVMAVPGPINSQQSQAPADLIKQGAKLVNSAEDVMEELNITSRGVDAV